MSHRLLASVLTAAICLSAVATGAVGLVGVASAAEDPRFEASVPEPVLEPGTTQELTVELTNDAADYDDEAERALDANATVAGASGIEVLSGSRELGTVGDEETRTVTVRVDVPADIAGGTHEIPITVAYRDVDDRDEVVTTTVTATVRVQERARFVVDSVESAAPVGSTGTVAVTFRNAGQQPATDAVVQFESGNAGLTFDESATARRFVGDLAPNESRTVEVDASFASSAKTREYAVDATVEYEDAGGTDATSRRLSFGVTPTPEQTFAVGDLESTLRVGEEGELRGTVTNTGDRPVTNAVVLFETENPNVSPLEPELAVGSLAPDESAEFAFDIEVSDAAVAGLRQFTLRVQYRDDGGTRRTGDDLDAPVSVAEPRDEFGVEVTDGRFAVGEGGTLVLSVTNRREEAVSDVSAKLFLDAPLSSTDDEGFVDELAPGETAEVTFDLSVAGSAIVGKTYPADVDFRYETADGDTLLSDTYRVPVTTTESDGDGLSLGVIGVGAVVVVGLLGAVYVRRNR